MAKSQLDVLKDEFQSECKVINLKYEYEGYTGEEQWAIISELTKKEMFEKYEVEYEILENDESIEIE